MKNILHLGAGRLMINNIILLKNAGYKVYLVDKSANAPAFEFADGYEVIDIVDTKKIELYANEIHADAIMAVNEAGVLSAAIVSEALGLISCPAEAVKKATDKGLMRLEWFKNKLSQPNFIICKSREDINLAINKLNKHCVLKPCLNWGSKGVSVINNDEDIEFAIDFALANNRNNRFIVEEYIEGMELTIEGLVQDNQISIIAHSDKEHQDHQRYRVAMALNYPANVSKNILNKLDNLIKQAVKSLGINNSAFHAECIVKGDDVFLIEMAARPGGGHIFGYIVKAVSGVNMPVVLAKILLGDKTSIYKEINEGACYKFFNAPKGLFKGIYNLDKLKKSKNILDIGFELKPNTKVDFITGDANRPGFIVSIGKTRESAIQNAQNAFNELIFDIEK